MSRHAKILLSVGLLLAAVGVAPPCAQAQSADPGPAWDTAESAHFRIHYRAAQRSQAERFCVVINASIAASKNGSHAASCTKIMCRTRTTRNDDNK